MSTLALELRDLTSQITLARPLFLLLVIVSLLLAPAVPTDAPLTLFFLAWFAVSSLIAFLEATHRLPILRLPLLADLATLLLLLYFSPSAPALWFWSLYVIFSISARWHWRPAFLVTILVTVGVILRQLLPLPLAIPHAANWLALIVGTAVSGFGAVYLGSGLRQRATQSEFLARLSSHLQVEKGIAESVRLFLADLASSYSCSKAMLAFRDDELDRLFVWTATPGDSRRITPENLPLERSDSLLLTELHINLCWNSFEGPGQGFAWDRTTHRPVSDVPRLPGPSVKERSLQNLAAVTFDFGSPRRPVGRILLANSARPFRPEDLKTLDRVARHIAPPIETLFLLRHLRARAIDAERSRISRDLHDGILQTLLSIAIQLDVLRRRSPQSTAELLADSISSLLQTVRNETEELRRMVTDLRPVRVQSADLLDLMQGFAERFRTEASLALDLIVQPLDQHVPDRLCRELFQLYREALYNVKKHARASHVVVKVWQDETRVFLLVDDNGQGFSFAGRFSGDELDRLRLGPISIKERTRSIGGVLNVESNPGHGSRLTVEIPFN